MRSAFCGQPDTPPCDRNICARRRHAPHAQVVQEVLEMKFHRALTGIALSCAAAFFTAQWTAAQDHSVTQRDQTTTTTTETHTYDGSNWQAPRGYDEAYP